MSLPIPMSMLNFQMALGKLCSYTIYLSMSILERKTLILNILECTNKDMKILQYIQLYIKKQYNTDYALQHLSLFEICAVKIWEKFVYKLTETIEYVKNQPTFLGKIETLRVNNLTIRRIKIATFLVYYFYMNKTIQRNL